jgi:Spy/CpxP family protein refolding chaperone
MRKKIVFCVMSLLLLVVIAQGVQADEKNSGMCPMCKTHEQMESSQADPGHYVHHLLIHAKEIGLSTDQITKLKVLRLDLERTRLKTDAEIRIADLELDALVEDEQAEFSAIEAKVKHEEALEAGLVIAIIKAKRTALALLTPDQRQKEMAVREMMMEHMMPGMMERMHLKPGQATPGSKNEHQH